MTARSATTTGTIVLLTRLARAVFLRSSVDLVGMNLKIQEECIARDRTVAGRCKIQTQRS